MLQETPDAASSRCVRVLVLGSPADAEQVERLLHDAGFSPQIETAGSPEAFGQAVHGGHDLAVTGAGVPRAETLAARRLLRARTTELPLFLLAAGGTSAEVEDLSPAEPTYDLARNRPTCLGCMLGLLTTSRRLVGNERRTQLALRQSPELMRDVIQYASDAVFIKDLEGRFLLVNPAAVAAFGRPEEELVGRTNAQVFPAALAERLSARDRAVLASGAGEAFDEELGQAEGRRGTFLVSLGIRRSPEGAPVGLLGIARDITERRQAEVALQEANRRLQEALEDLKKAQSRLVEQERLHALGRMSSGVAHDLNNALVPVVGFSDLLLSRRERWKDDEFVARYLGLIHTAARDATDVVRRLRFFARGSELETPVEEIDCEELLADLVGLSQPRWKDEALAAGLTIHLEKRVGRMPRFWGNRAALREALVNLVFNAVEALPSGGTIRLTAGADGDKVLLSVEDDGVGMEESVRSRCFEPFFTTKGEKGTGLGLAMVYGIVEKHGGTVEVRSAPGQGAAFLLRLPPGSPLPAGPSAIEAAQPLPPLQILLVDDEAPVREAVGTLLSLDGHTVNAVDGAEPALAALAGGRFDVLITDFAMPRHSGEDLAREARARAPGMPIILLTGLGDLMAARGEKPPNADVLLSKPVLLSDLRQALRSLKLGRTP